MSCSLLSRSALRCSQQLRSVSSAASVASVRSSVLSLCLATASTPYTLPELPYSYSALEPAISGKIMETHHSKHHAAYVAGLNAAVAQLGEAQASKNAAKIAQLTSALKFHGGGHVNHSIFWTNLAPKSAGGGAPPTGALAKQIEADFGSFEALKAQMSAQSVAIQGSGWGWLGYNTAQKRLEIITKANQDPLTEAVPLLGLDVWEHAYYYSYGPARAEYLKQIWTVVNWQNVSERFAKAQQAK